MGDGKTYVSRLGCAGRFLKLAERSTQIRGGARAIWKGFQRRSERPQGTPLETGT
jgi:hypothetical protein